MILLTILAIIATILAAIAFSALVVGGTAFVIIFGDIIVCVVFIVLLIRWLFKRKKWEVIRESSFSLIFFKKHLNKKGG